MIGFDGQRYIQLQRDAIQDRITKFDDRLYLEVGGKFLHDGHASRVLPGFQEDSKQQIFSQLYDQMNIIFCINYDDIIHNRQLVTQDIDYLDYVFTMLDEIQHQLQIKPYVVCNKCDPLAIHELSQIRQLFKQHGYTMFCRYLISGYPHNTELILSKQGFGSDEYVPCNKPLVLVTGAASNSGKMSTCMGQIYHEATHGQDSGYAKYETFPIWNLPLHHPVNLAYEAATADIGDYNMSDPYHERAYGVSSVNYNRDVEAFEIVQQLAQGFLDTDNYTRHYQSPTDMGINQAGFAINNDKVCCVASLQEIIKRQQEYRTMIARGEGKQQRVDRCIQLEQQCRESIS